MALMVLPYNRILEFTNGHIIRFKQDHPTNVPMDLVETIIERGGKVIKANNIVAKTFDDGTEQEEAGKITVIHDAINRLSEEGDPRNLTGTGEVSVDAVRKAVAPMPMSNALFTKAKLSMPEVMAEKSAVINAVVDAEVDQSKA